MCLFIQMIWENWGKYCIIVYIIDKRVRGALGAVSESLCLGRLINHPPKLTFSSPVGAKVVNHDPYNETTRNPLNGSILCYFSKPTSYY